ncbi:DUF6586 family protein [Pontibacter sp. JAM-7]|uniref:DUF6586 family protein n=1 Tax=Pontibacter sp. JAM-7 TaxID=3366581 RepID=UPI003AF4C17F
MSGIYLARTNQKLNFSRIHLECLKAAQDDSSWNKHAKIESFNESVLFHLAATYDAFLREVAEYYRVDTEQLDGYRSLAATIEATGVESPELKRLSQLEADQKNWLHQLLAAYEACWHGADKQQPKAEVSSVSEIHVLQINPDHAEDAELIAEYERWLSELSALIASLRESMQEW